MAGLDRIEIPKKKFMTPCTYKIDYIFERYFPQYWHERLCFRVYRWNSMVLGTTSGLLCYFSIDHYRTDRDVDFTISVSSRSERKVASMSDCVHIFLIGPSGSGKTTLAKELEGRGYERILAYTTRPPRDNEDESSDYIFVTDEEFQNAFLDGELTCVRTYSTIFGTWSYGFAWSDLYRAVDSIAVIDPESYLRIYDQIENCFGIYLDIPDDVRKARLMIRGDNPEEIDRRLKTDAQDFAALDMCFKDVCKMRIGMVRRPDIDADRIEGHVRDFRSKIFAKKTYPIVKD